MTINSEDIRGKVNAQMAVIGKNRDEKFANVVVSSGQIEVIDEFVREALLDIISKSHGVFYGYSKSGNGYTISSKSDGVEPFVESYVITYCIWSVLLMYDINGIDVLIRTYSAKVDKSYSELIYFALEHKIPNEVNKLSGTSGSCTN